MLDLLCVGDVKQDTFIIVNDANVMCEIKKPECKLCIRYGEKIPVEAFVTQTAGSAPNVAIGVGRGGFSTGVLSVMGNDEVSREAKRFLAQEKVSTALIKIKKGQRSSAAVVLNFKGESTQLVDFVPQHYELPQKLQTHFLHICELGSGYEKLYAQALKAAQKGVRISVNPGAVQLKDRKPELFDLLSVCEVLFVNMIEARWLLKKEEDDGIHGIMAQLKAMGPKYVVVTDGAHGAYAYDGKQLDVVPAFPAHMKEATGAGDAFSAGFLAALMKGKPHREALRWGAVNAASVVSAVGPTAGLLSAKTMLATLKKHPSYQTKEL